MKKKKGFWFKKIMKTVGISLASIVGFVSASVGVYALFGGFKEKIIPVEGMNFEQAAYVLVGTTVDDKSNKLYDDRIRIIPTNEGATPTIVTLKGDSNVVVLPDESKTSKNLELELVQAVSGGVRYSVGGEFELSAILEEKSFYCKTTVFVDSKISSFDLEFKKEDGELVTSATNLYPGSKFKASVKNYFPSNALDVPSSENIQSYKSIYGDDFFNKTILYFSSNKSIATVNTFTGEVEVLTEGEFTISAYYIVSYEANKEVFLTEGNSYVEFLDNNNYFCKNSGTTFESKPIDVAGISATHSSFDLNVFETYVYSVTDPTVKNYINLAIQLDAPADTNFTDDQLDYRKKDIEFFEGYKEGDKYYISQNQDKYFSLDKSNVPLYFTVKPIDFTELKDLYLILRIGKTKLEKEQITSNIECVNDNGETTDGDWVYYAFVKVNTKIIENEQLSLKNDKILASFSESDTDKYLRYNDGILDLSTLLEVNSPDNATYRYVRYFVKNNGSTDDKIVSFDVDETQEEIVENEVPKTIIKDEEGNEISSGYYLKGLKEGTIQIYAAIYKTDEDGKLILDEEGNPHLLIQSGEITLVVSKDIEFNNFRVEATNPYNIENGKINEVVEVTKGNNVTISFETTNTTGFKKAYREGFFEVKSTVDSLVSTYYDLPADGSESNKITITLTARTEGEARISIVFNGKNLLEFDMSVPSDSITNISLCDNETEILNEELKFVLSGGTATNALKFNLDINGTTKIDIENFELAVKAEGGTTDGLRVSIPSNYFSYFEEIKIEDGKILITPKAICSDIEFYVYDINSNVKSKTYLLSVVLPDNFEITENYKNLETINLTKYEKVIGGETFNFKEKFLTFTNLSADLFGYECVTRVDDNLAYNGTSFIDVDEIMTCQINLTANFIEGGIYKTYNFYVLPKYMARASSLSVNAGESLDKTTLQASIQVFKNYYDATDDNKIKTEELSTGLTKSFNKIETGDNTTKGEYDEVNYISPANSLDDSIDYLGYNVAYTNETEQGELSGKITINISSTLEIENNNQFLQNGGEYNLESLFKVMNTSNSLQIILNSIDVTLTVESANLLKQKGIRLFQNNVEITVIDNDNYKLINKILIPEDFNLLSIEDIKADVKVTFSDNSISIKKNHNFTLDFELTTLTINADKLIQVDDKDIIYLTLTEESDNGKIKSMIISSASVLTKNLDSPSNEINSVVILKESNKITFTLNKISKTYDYIAIDSFITKKTDSRIIGKAYSVTDLIEFASELQDKNISCVIKTVINNGTESEDDFVVQENNNVVVFKNAGTYSITFEILGREVSFDYTISDIEIALLEDSKIYSNLTYSIFTSKPDGLDIQYVLYENISTGSDENYQEIANYTEWFVGDSIKVPNYDGSEKTLKLVITFKTAGYTEVSKEVKLKLHSLNIQTQFNNVDSQGNQILYKGLVYNLSSGVTSTPIITTNGHSTYIMNLNPYYSVSTSDSTLVLNYSLTSLEQYSVSQSSGSIISLDISLGIVPVKTIKFIVKELTLTTTAPTDVAYFQNQIVKYQDLQDYVTIKDKDTGAQIDYKDKLVFVADGTEIMQDGQIVLDANSKTIKVYLGDLTSNDITIDISIVEWSRTNSELSLQAFSGTKVSNYISCKIKDTTTQLTLNYKPSDSVISTLDGDIYKITVGSQIVKLNSITGEIEVPSSMENGFSVVAYVVNAPNENKILEFSISKLDKTAESTVQIYAGDNTTDLTQFGYYKSGSNTYKNIDFEIIERVVDETLGYSYHINNLTGDFEIWKSGKVVGKIAKNAKGYLTNFVATSEIDTMTIKIRGVLKSIGTQDITILDDNYIDMTLQVYSISVDFEGSSLLVNDLEYNIVQDAQNNRDTTFAISPTISNGVDSDLKFTELNFVSGFIGNPKSQYSTLQNLVINENTITMPSGYSLSINTEEVGKFVINSTKPLIDYAFLILEFKVQSFSGTVNIVLVPKMRNIVFYSDNVSPQEGIYYASVYSPSVYALTIDGALFGFSSEDMLQNDNVLIGQTGGIFKSSYENANHTLTYNFVTQGSTLVIVTNTNTNTVIEYVIRFVFDKSGESSGYTYDYMIRISNIIIDYNSSLKIPSEDCDLKSYIGLTIDGIAFDQYANSEIKETLKFTVDNSSGYRIDENGNFSRLDNIISNDITAKFSVLGKEYEVVLQKDELSTKFYFDTNKLAQEEKYSLNASTDYYIYSVLTEEGTGESIERTIDTYLSSSAQDKTLSSEITVSLKNIIYSFAGSQYTQDNFDISESGNVIEYSFGGEILIVLTRYNNYYILSLKDVDNLIFDISVTYSSLTASKTVNVSSKTIEINYINPSIVNSIQYKNLLSGESLDLTTLIVKSDDFSLSFELESYNSYISLTEAGVISSVLDVPQEQLVKVKVIFGNSIDYINVRIIPSRKVVLASNSKIFYVQQNDVIDLTKYAKLLIFSSFDSNNEPRYSQSFDYKIPIDVENETYEPIENYLEYQIGTSETQIYLDNMVLKFIPITITISNQTLGVGETKNIKDIVRTVINQSNLTLKDYSLSFESAEGFVSDSGIFTATRSGDFVVDIKVGTISYAMHIEVKEVSIDITYNNSLLLTNSNGITIRYENIYATQVIENAQCVSVSDERDISHSLNFSLEILDYGSYVASSISVSNSQNAVYIKDGDGNNILSVSKDTIECYKDLKSEMLVQIVYSIENNSLVSNNFNLRLLPVSLKVNSNLDNADFVFDNTYLTNDELNLINNVATASTICENYNLNLNDKIVFTVVSSTLTGLVVNDERQSIVIEGLNSDETATIDLKITLGQDANKIETLRTITFKNTGTQNTNSVFVDDTLNSGSKIIAIRKSDKPVYYTLKSTGTDVVYDVFDSDTNLLCTVSLTGVLTNTSSKGATFTIEATNSNRVDKGTITISGEETSLIAIEPSQLKEENGIKYLELLSKEVYSLAGKIDSSTSIESLDGVYEATINSEKSIVANTVSEITYGYFTLMKGAVKQKVYVKIYPYNLNKTYTEDYTYTGTDINIEDVNVLKNGDKFKTIYIGGQTDVSLLNYFKVVSEKLLSHDVSFEIIKYKGVETNTGFVVNGSEGEFIDGASISNSILTLKDISEYFIKVNASFNEENLVLNFRVLKVNAEQSETLSVENNSIINLQDVVKNNEIYNSVKFTLLGGTNSYIEGNYLYVNENEGAKIVLKYSINGIVTKVIINILPNTDANYCYNSKNYKEIFYSSDASNIGQIIGVNSIIFDGTEYKDTDIEMKTEKVDDTEIVAYYLNEKIRITASGEVTFYDAGQAKYINANNLGIFYINVSKTATSAVSVAGVDVDSISYTYSSNYKLNNYQIEKVGTTYKYYENGTEIANVLRYTLVYADGTESEALYYTSGSNKFIKLNGKIVNITTGEVSGEYQDASKVVVLKVYVKEENANFGTKFILETLT